VIAGLLVVVSCGSTEKSTPTNNTTGSSAGQTTPGSAATSTPAYAATLQSQIPEIMKANAIPGAIVQVKSRDKGNWSATFGTAELDKTIPMKLNDQFRVGSNTKTMTVTVILQLVQEGKLKLDDVLEKFVPGFPNGDKITIAQLAEMRSGLYSYTSDLGFNETLDKQPQKAWTPDELLSIAKPHPPLFAPGTEYNYSNTNLTALGVIIEKITGQSATEAFQKRIFGPLGLKNTLLPVQTDAALPDPHPQGYQFLTNAETVDSDIGVEQEGDDITVSRYARNAEPPGMNKIMWPDVPSKVDKFTRIRWMAPSTLRLVTGVCRPGETPEQGSGYHAVHILTPETDETTHYFFTAVRFGIFSKGDELNKQIQEKVAATRRFAFEEQDAPVIEAQQRIIDASQTAVDPLTLAIDVGPVRYKQVLKKLIAAEQAP